MIERILKFFLTIYFSMLFRFDKRMENSDDLTKVIKLYQTGGFAGTFSKIRIWDAPLKIIEKLTAKKGVIVDLGCGDGLIANYLALNSPNRKVLGIELNPVRAKEAKKGIQNTEFRQGDILKEDFPPADTILLVHVLHHLSSYEIQVELINRCKTKLNKDGKLIIVEINQHPLLKYILTWAVDVIIFPILFEKKLFNFKIFYRSQKKWQDLLEDAGFRVNALKADSDKPFSHLILSCQRGYNR